MPAALGRVVSPIDLTTPPRRGPGGRPLLGTIDLYVLKTFIWNYLLFLVVLIGLYVVIDMVVKFDEFTEVTGGSGVEDVGDAMSVIWGIVDFYRFQVFRIFALLGGLIPVVAAAFTLMRLSRNNELVAMLAAGVPALRVAAPIIFAAVVLNLVLLPANQELIVPGIASQLTREHGARDALRAGEVLSGVRGKTEDGVDLILHAGAYFPPLGRRQANMQNAEFLEWAANNSVTIVSADFAVWDPTAGAWRLENGRRELKTQLSHARRESTPVEQYRGTITPEAISLFIDHAYVDLLSTARINQLLSAPAPIGLLDLLRVRDARLAGFVLNIVLVLLTIPCVLTREPLMLRAAATRVFVLVGLCMATIFVTQNIAGQPPPDPEWITSWPALMAWLPIFVFGPIAVFMLDRVKS